MAINLNVSENQERVALNVNNTRTLRTITPDDGSPYYVGARAYVTQTAGGAIVTVIDKDGTTTATISNGADGQDGADGADGVGIADISLTSTSGLVDTYTITYDNGDTDTFTVTNGQDGQDGADGQDGQDGADGQDGYSPTATVSKSGDTATITITDINGTTTASISDGASGTSAFEAEYGVTTYADVKAAYDDDEILVCTVDDSGNTMVLQLVYFDATSEIFYFAFPTSDGWYMTMISNADGWGDGTWYFASTDVATQLSDGLMSALDKQKLDGLSKRNIWYGTCSTSSSQSPKSITTASGDFSLTAGNMLAVLFSHTNSLSSVSLQVDGGTSKSAYSMDGTSDISNRWGSSEVVMFVYDGTKFVMFEQGLASPTQYGITKLNNTVTSTSTSEAATANAVKLAYENCGVTDVTLDGNSVVSSGVAALTSPTIPVTDVTLDGTSVVSSGVAALTSPTIPTKTSDLVNDSLFARGHIASFHGTCSTAAATAAKAVTCADFKAADLVAGAIIVVSFSNANSAAVADLTLNVNSTGAYHIKYNNAGTLSNIGDKTYLKATSYMFYFDGTYWVLAGYDTNTNTVGYTIRTNGLQLLTKTQMYRYRICFTSADGEYFVPANSSTSTSATASKTVTTEKIDPFGRIVYYNTTAAVAANSYPTAANLVQQYNGLTLGYSFNRTGAALTLTNHKPVYVKCAPQTDGSAIIDADNPFVQALPSTADGKLYIFLGIATAATTIEMTLEHPVYEYKNGHIREYTPTSEVSVTQVTSTGTKIATIDVDGTSTDLYAPSGGGGTVTDVTVDGTSVVTGGVAAVDLTGKSDIGHTHTTSAITDFPSLATVATSGSYSDLSNKPSIPTITDTYSGTSSDGMSGKAVKSAIDALDGTISGSAGSGKTLTAFSQTDGKVSATFGNISITKSQVSDFPTIPTVNNATLTIQKNSTNVATFTANASSNVTADISVPTDTGDLTNGAGFITSSDLPPYVAGSYTALGYSTSDGSLALADDIDNYKFLLVHLYQTASDAVDGTGFIPVALFKSYNTTLHAFGINVYNSGRKYGYINYVDNTTANVQVSANYGVAVYGIK